MTRILAVAVVIGTGLVVIGVGLVFPPAGLVVCGGALIAFGLLTDDGEAPDASA